MESFAGRPSLGGQEEGLQGVVGSTPLEKGMAGRVDQARSRRRHGSDGSRRLVGKESHTRIGNAIHYQASLHHKACNTWTEWLSLAKEFGHVMLNLKPRDDSDPWNVAWPSDTHRRLEVLGDNKVVFNQMNGAWEVKGDEHAVLVRGVVDQFVRWFLGGTFRPRTDENDWCRHNFLESNKAAYMFDGQW